jgi:hypothetical protein
LHSYSTGNADMSIPATELAKINDLINAYQAVLLARVLAATQTFQSETADADPGAGNFRFNNSTISSVTMLYLDDEETDGTSLAPLILSYDDSDSITKGRLTLQDTATSDNWATFKVTGAVVSATGYAKVPVEYIAHSGTFDVDAVFSHTFSQTGDAGTMDLDIGSITEGNPASATISETSPGVFELDLVLPVGSTGPIGPQGDDGATIITTTGVPDDATDGSDGDFAFDKTNKKLHGPKAGGVWPAGTSLLGNTGAQGIQGPQGAAGPQGDTGPQGNQGAAGLDGKTIHAVTAAAPADSLGVNGDYAIKSSTSQMWGPKASDTWTGTEFSIRGQQGDQGIQGDKGDKGDQGPQGIQGETGTQGPAGNTIRSTTGKPADSIGVNGDYAVDIAALEIFGPKAAGTWPDATSFQGTQGVQGDAGPVGPGWHDGAGPPTVGDYDDGDLYFDTTNSAWYGPKASGVMPGPNSLVGAQGPQGDQGIQGPQGDQGIQGPAGDGDVDGPDGGVVDNEVALFDGTTGKLLKGSGTTVQAMIDQVEAAFDGVIEDAAAAEARTGSAPIIERTDTLTTFDFTVNLSRPHLINTTPTVEAGALTGVLPETPALGDEVSFMDIGDFSVHNFTISRNGNNIAGLDEDLVCNAAGDFATLRFIGGTTGWKVSLV